MYHGLIADDVQTIATISKCIAAQFLHLHAIAQRLVALGLRAFAGELQLQLWNSLLNPTFVRHNTPLHGTFDSC